MILPAQMDTASPRHRLMRLWADDAVLVYGYDVPHDVMLDRYVELLDRLVLLPHLHHLALQLLRLLAHALGHQPHLPSLHGEYARLILVLLDLLGAAGVGHILLLDARGDLLDHVLVVAHVLLHLAGVDVQI